MSIYMGLLSGTSMDGIDCALIDVAQDKFIAGITVPYSQSLKKRLGEALLNSLHPLNYYVNLHQQLGREFAEAACMLLKKASVSAHEVRAIGSHGQTICHNVAVEEPYSVQLGCAHTIAEKTGITVVADFRTRDLVIGGQGAPLAPLFHQHLFRNFSSPLAIINIGGIANITLLSEQRASGYDVGPGNCLMDAWAQQHLKKPYDEAGAWAATGQVIQPMLNALLADPYFQQIAPKSIGKEYFSIQWIREHIPSDAKACDVQATLLALTVLTIANNILQYNGTVRHVFICGGGVHNRTLLDNIRQALTSVTVDSKATIGVDPDFIEAQLFAWLAEKTTNNKPVDLCNITGARHPTLLGAIYPKNTWTCLDKANSIEV